MCIIPVCVQTIICHRHHDNSATGNSTNVGNPFIVDSRPNFWWQRAAVGNGLLDNRCQLATQRSKPLTPNFNHITICHSDMDSTKCRVTQFPNCRFPFHIGDSNECTERCNVNVCNFESCVHFSQSFTVSNSNPKNQLHERTFA